MMGRLARAIGSLVLLGALVWWVDMGAVFARLYDVSLPWGAVALLALSVATLSMARRWQMTAQALGLELSYGTALKEYYVALLGNAVLPGGVVGDISRAIRLRHRGDMRRAAHSVLAERAMGQAAMFLILALGLLGSVLVPGGIIWPLNTAAFVGAGVVLGALVLTGLARFAPTQEFIRLCKTLLAQPQIALHALGAAFALLLGLYACARATGTILPVEAVVTILPLVFCAMLVPLSIAGWGWREGAAAALFPLVSAEPEAGIAMGICYGAVMVIAALPGAAFVLRASPQPGLERA